MHIPYHGLQFKVIFSHSYIAIMLVASSMHRSLKRPWKILFVGKKMMMIGNVWILELKSLVYALDSFLHLYCGKHGLYILACTLDDAWSCDFFLFCCKCSFWLMYFLIWSSVVSNWFGIWALNDWSWVLFFILYLENLLNIFLTTTLMGSLAGIRFRGQTKFRIIFVCCKISIINYRSIKLLSADIVIKFSPGIFYFVFIFQYSYFRIDLSC